VISHSAGINYAYGQLPLHDIVDGRILVSATTVYVIYFFDAILNPQTLTHARTQWPDDWENCSCRCVIRLHPLSADNRAPTKRHICATCAACAMHKLSMLDSVESCHRGKFCTRASRTLLHLERDSLSQCFITFPLNLCSLIAHRPQIIHRNHNSAPAVCLEQHTHTLTHDDTALLPKICHFRPVLWNVF